MSFASKTIVLPSAPLLSDIGETLRFDRALDLRYGGTGVAASGADNAARAIDVLKTWGALDSGGKFTLAWFPDISSLIPAVPAMAGATSGAAGTAGTVPQPGAGKQKQPLLGDATYANEFELRWITDSAGNRLHQFAIVGDGENGWFFGATGSGAGRSRLGPRSDIDEHIDAVFEPKGRGQCSQFGDAFERTIQRAYGHRVHADAATFENVGLSSGLTTETSSGPVSLDDLDGHYSQAFTATTSGSNGGHYSVNAWVQRWHSPEIIFVGRSAFIDARVWLAAADADPAALTSLHGSNVAGVGVWVDYSIHAPGRTVRLVTSSGAAYSLSKTGIVSVDSSGRLDRNDGGSWITDGVRVGDLITLSGFASGAGTNNGQHRVASITAGSGRRLVFDTPLPTIESPPAGAVVVAHEGGSEVDTGVVLTANTRFAIRLRYLPTTYQWEASFYNFTTKSWGNATLSSGVSPVPPETKLKLWWRNRSLATSASGINTACQAMLVRNGT